MRFAPVIIPTLNREEHLDRCLHSLGCNGIYAKKTEVFISVDYPPSDTYCSGYKKVKKLLEWYRKHHKFYKLHIYFQRKNLGPSRNSEFLFSELKKRGFDKFIYSEDDNEFAPNFLKYINEGLELFEQNENIVSINGFKDIAWINNNNENIIGAKLFSAYGYGGWLTKRARIWRDIESFLLSPKTMSPKITKKLYKRNRYLFALYVNGIITQNSGIFWNSNFSFRVIDSAVSIYLHLTDKICIIPDKTKVHNWGCDGSGVNMEKRNKNTGHELELDTCFDFDYSCKKIIFDEANFVLGDRYLTETFQKRFIWLACIKYIIFIILGSNREKMIILRNVFRRKK